MAGVKAGAGAAGGGGGLGMAGSGELSGEEMDKKIVEYSPQRRYVRFNEILGKGAYKMVYRAYDTKEGLLVAWNTISLSGLPKHEKVRIMHEVRLLEQLDHGNIISFFGSWVNREKEEVVFITEILSSGSLKDFIKKVQVIRWKIIKRWCKQILRGLSYLHGHEPPIIHRDLKCDNIFINGSSGDLRIGDLGLSTYINSQTKPLSVLGTPEFMAPELYDEKYDEKVDVYAFGMCVLEMISKETPYCECTNAAQIFKKVTSMVPPQVLYRVRNEKAREFIHLCIQQDPKARPSVDELLNHAFLKQHDEDDEEVLVDATLDTSSMTAFPPLPRRDELRLNGGGHLSSSLHQPSPRHHVLSTPQSHASTSSTATEGSTTLSSSDHGQPQQQPSLSQTLATTPASTTASTQQQAQSSSANDATGKGQPANKKPLQQQSSLGGSQSGYSSASEMDNSDQMAAFHSHDGLQGGGGEGPSTLHEDPHPASTTGKSQGGGMMSQASSSASLAVSVDGSHYTSAMDVSTPDLTRSASDMTLDSAGASPVVDSHHHHHHHHDHHGPHHGEPPPSRTSPNPMVLSSAQQQQGAAVSRAQSFHGLPQEPLGHVRLPAAGQSATFTRSGVVATNPDHTLHHEQGGPKDSAASSLEQSQQPQRRPSKPPVDPQQQPRPPPSSQQQTAGQAKPANPPSALTPQISTDAASPHVAPKTPGMSLQQQAPMVEVREGEAGMPCCIPLVIRARMNGKLKDIEFDFNLETDDAQQVAQEMVSELGLPVSDARDIVRFINDLAEKARHQEMVAPAIYHAHHPPPPPQPQQPPPPSHGHQRGSHGASDLPPLPAAKRGSSSAIPGASTLLPVHTPTPQQPHVDQPSSHSSRPRDGSLDSLGHLPDAALDHPDDDARSSPPGSVGNDEEVKAAASSLLGHMAGGGGGMSDDDLDAEADLVGDDDFAKLRAEYEKNKARSRKAFDIRLENLQKSKAEKEESHKKLQDKYLKEMAEFEKKKLAAEKEQEQRLRELEEHWRAARAEYKEKKRLSKAAHQLHHLTSQGSGPSTAASSAASSPLPVPHPHGSTESKQAHSSLHPDEGVAAPGHQRQRTSRASETPVLSDTAAHLQGEVTPLLGGDGHHHHHHHHYSIDKEQGGGPADGGNSPSASSTTAPPHA